MNNKKHLPFLVIGIKAFSGTGKTTLIENMLPILKTEGFAVGVLKHIHHAFHIDTPGKDTDRFYQAGADFVFAHDARQGVARQRNLEEDVFDMISRFPSDLDLLIVEGYKDIDMPGIWLMTSSQGNNIRNHDDRGNRIILRDDPGYLDQALSFVREQMARFHQERMIMAGLMVGRDRFSEGIAKRPLETSWEMRIENTCRILSEVTDKVLLLGSGVCSEGMRSVDRLPDIPGMKGPFAGMLSAFRWSPGSAWIIAHDTALLHRELLEWLLRQRRPGSWAVIPMFKGEDSNQARIAVYEPTFFGHVEALARKGATTLGELVMHQKVITPPIPDLLCVKEGS